MKHGFALGCTCIVLGVWLLSCTSSGGDDDPVTTDGDEDVSENDPTEDGDEPDGDETDGDEQEQEEEIDDSDGDGPPELSCDEPADLLEGSWSPATSHPDAPFLFKRTTLVEGALGGGVYALAQEDDGSLLAAGEAGLFRLDENNTPQRLTAWPEQPITALWVLSDHRLLAASGSDLLLGSSSEEPTTLSLTATVKKLAPQGDGTFRVLLSDGQGLHLDPSTQQTTAWFGPLEGLTVNGCLPVEQGAILATDQGLRLWNEASDTVSQPWSGEAAGQAMTDLTSLDGETLWATAQTGLVQAAFSGGDVTLFNEAQGLPYRVWTRLAFVTDQHPILLGEKGAYFNLHQDWMKAHLLHSRYYVPSRDIRDALWIPTESQATTGTLVLASSAGIGLVRFANATLREKAAALDEGMVERHDRFGMFSRCVLAEPGDLSQPIPVDDDNDGQWTNMYLASQSFRYAATGEEAARDNALRAAEGMLRLLTITGKKGFLARSVVEPERCEQMQQTGGEWHLSENGEWCWKGDTSGDEYVGHMFGLSLFYDLVADETWKARVRDAFIDLHDGIIENGYILEDIDGKRTSHGYFDPEFMHGFGRFGDSGLYSAMILGGLRATYHMSGEQRFLDAFYHLAVEEGYREYVSEIESINLTTHTNHDAEEMSFLALATLIRYETEPCLMADWQAGLQELWDVQIPEHNPEFNFIYAWLKRTEDFLLNEGVATLQQFHDHGIQWSVTNSDRLDITINPENDRFDDLQSIKVLPFDQKAYPRWSENPFRLDDSGSGRAEEMLISYLLPYWLGRYLRAIDAPATQR